MTVLVERSSLSERVPNWKFHCIMCLLCIGHSDSLSLPLRVWVWTQTPPPSSVPCLEEEWEDSVSLEVIVGGATHSPLVVDLESIPTCFNSLSLSPSSRPTPHSELPFPLTFLCCSFKTHTLFWTLPPSLSFIKTHTPFWTLPPSSSSPSSRPTPHSELSLPLPPSLLMLSLHVLTIAHHSSSKTEYLTLSNIFNLSSCIIRANNYDYLIIEFGIPNFSSLVWGSIPHDPLSSHSSTMVLHQNILLHCSPCKVFSIILAHNY